MQFQQKKKEREGKSGIAVKTKWNTKKRAKTCLS
jgi:hypothetical protein